MTEHPGSDRDGGAFPSTLVGRVWNSPTLMTWGSLVTRSLSALVVLPLVLTRLSPAEIVVWYLFRSFNILQLLADLGFSPTFTRVIGFALAGLDEHQLRDLRQPIALPEHTQPNWRVLERICATMRAVYARLAGLAVLLLLGVGTATVAHPIGALASPGGGWAAWALVVVTSGVTLHGNRYSAYLQGADRIALLRRWESLMNAAVIVTSIVVLLLGGRLLALVVASEVWKVLHVLRNRWLARHVLDGRFRTFRERRIDRPIWDAVWPPAWRGGLGALFAQAPLQFTGMVFAQIGAPDRVAAYLLAMHLLTTLRTYAMVPFYAKIPTLIQLRAQHRLSDLRNTAARVMRRAHWTYVLGFVAVGAGAAEFVRLIGSTVAFIPTPLWVMFGAAAFAERYGAMHLLLYGTTNHIVAHLANGVTTLVYAALATALFPLVNWYGFAVAYTVANVMIFAPYAARLSYRSIDTRPLDFERGVGLAPAAVVLGFTLLAGFWFWP